MAAYYNEFDPKAAAWLRELIKAGMIAPGDVDERSITDVQPNDLAGYTQCHFFAGVGGWSIAARLAGWPDDRELWTGSCPCQPFSVAGKGAGASDARHLWPDFFRLIRSRRPAVVMGEQVAAAVGKNWLDGVFDDLEGVGYACEAAIAPACAVNAPHRRDRLWFVAGCSVLEHAPGIGRREGRAKPELRGGRPAAAGASLSRIGLLADASGGVNLTSSTRADQWPVARGDGESHAVSTVADDNGSGWSSGPDHSPARHGHTVAAASGPGAWAGARWLIGHDGKARRVEPSIPLLVDGIPARAPLLRGYGNAIVPALAAEVIGAWMDCNP